MRRIRDRWVPNINGFVFIIMLAIGAFFVLGAGLATFDDYPIIGEIGIVGVIILLFLVSSGFRILQPNESAILIFFGQYVGTIKKSGFRWSLPFTSTNIVSLRYITLNTEPLKVNDAMGNPIEIGAVVVWRIKDSAKAMLSVDNYERYVSVQAETALRTLAVQFPYDSQDDEVSLRGSTSLISTALVEELQERLDVAGVEVIEARLSHLAYAPEIASAMLKRQQAYAVVNARRVIAENAVSMVENVITDLEARSVLSLSNDQKASLVSNLMVALVADGDAQPILDIGRT